MYWLFNKDPYNGVLQSPCNWVVQSPIYPKQPVFFIAQMMFHLKQRQVQVFLHPLLALIFGSIQQIVIYNKKIVFSSNQIEEMCGKNILSEGLRYQSWFTSLSKNG